MKKETQDAERKPSMSRVSLHLVFSVFMAFSFVLYADELVNVGFGRLTAALAGLSLAGAGAELVAALRGYLRVVDARDQLSSELSPSHYYPHFAKEAELDSFLERRATLDPPPPAPPEEDSSPLSVDFEAVVQA